MSEAPVDTPARLSPEIRDLPPFAPVSWFSENTDLRSVSPYAATESDVWVVTGETEEIIAMALVEDGEIHRLGVAPELRREGIASALIDHVSTEYGDLELICRESLEANEFYAETGWEQIGVRWGDPEDLIEWRLTDAE